MDTTDQEVTPLKQESQETDPIKAAELRGARIAAKSIAEEVATYSNVLKMAKIFLDNDKPLPAGINLGEIINELADVAHRNLEAVGNNTLDFGHQNGQLKELVLNTHHQADNFQPKQNANSILKKVA